MKGVIKIITILEDYGHSFQEYLLNESFAPILPITEDLIDNYKITLRYLSNNILNAKNIDKIDLSTIIDEYYNKYEIHSSMIDIDELLSIYNDCKYLLRENNNEVEYNDENLEYNGFIKSTFRIHAHDSKRAPFHWDFRFKTEFGTSAYSFVLLKHKMPDDNEKLLVKQQPMHPHHWVDLDHTQIKPGEYGAGSVTTIDFGDIYYKLKDRSFSFYINGNIYKGAYHLINLKKSLFLLFKAQDSILVDKDVRIKEWINYARNFLSYLNKTFYTKFNINNNILPVIPDNPQLLDEIEYNNSINSNNNSSIITLPSITYCIYLKKNIIEDIISKECNINNIEDVMRLLILRNNIAPTFFNYLSNLSNNSNIINDIYDDTKDSLFYSDNQLEHIKNESYSMYPKEKIYRAFSDIYLGHKFYSQFDFERYLMNLIKKI